MPQRPACLVSTHTMDQATYETHDIWNIPYKMKIACDLVTDQSGISLSRYL